MIFVETGSVGPNDHVVICHGGAEHPNEDRDGAAAACDAGISALDAGGDCPTAAIATVRVLEDYPRFNAGIGSAIRLDGLTIACDASLMDDRNGFGAVAYLKGVRHPIEVARLVFDSPHRLVVAEGAEMLARSAGIATDFDLRCPEGEQRYEEARRLYAAPGAENSQGWETSEWRRILDTAEWPRLREDDADGDHTPIASSKVEATDTVGAVVRGADGRMAAGASTGGGLTTLPGRVGDVPFPGAGIFVSPKAGVVVTGHGESCIDRMVSREIHDAVLSADDPAAAVRGILESFASTIPIGILALSQSFWVAGANTTLPWFVKTSPAR